MSFHLDTFTYAAPANVAGRFPAGATADYTFKSGDVIRVLPEGSGFGDAVVLGFAEDGECKVSRPYAYASCVGTTGPSVLLGAETYTLRPNDMKHLAPLNVKRQGGNLSR